MLVPVRRVGVGGRGTSWGTWARDGKRERESWQLDDVGRYITCSAEILSYINLIYVIQYYQSEDVAPVGVLGPKFASLGTYI